ncbi:MAG: DNA-binding protein [Chloroflexota bacterium]
MLMKNEPESDFPKLSAPAQRALTGAGYTRLEQLAGVSATELMKLHGFGANALEKLRGALAAKGMSLADGKK